MIDKRKKSTQAEFTKWFGPLLNALRELGGSGRPKEVVEEIAKAEKIKDSQREEVMKSGILRFDNQVAWARQYLVWEGLLDNSKKGVWTLSSKGQETFLTQDDARTIFLNGLKSIRRQKKINRLKIKLYKLKSKKNQKS